MDKKLLRKALIPVMVWIGLTLIPVPPGFRLMPGIILPYLWVSSWGWCWNRYRQRR